MRMKRTGRSQLVCHMCSVREKFGREIKVIGIYSICDWCFENIIPRFAAAFQVGDEEYRG
jgi:hypothetical protein